MKLFTTLQDRSFRRFMCLPIPEVYGPVRTGSEWPGLVAHLRGMVTSNRPGAREPLLSIKDLAEFLGVPIATIYDWRRTGQGPCAIRVGRALRFSMTDVDAWLDERHEARPGQLASGEGRWL